MSVKKLGRQKMLFYKIEAVSKDIEEPEIEKNKQLQRIGFAV